MTVMTYRATAGPKFWVPPFIGSYTIRTQTLRQFEHMAREMLRRAKRGDMARESPCTEHR